MRPRLNTLPLRSLPNSRRFFRPTFLILVLTQELIRMAGMTGTFNASVQSEINGQSTAPIGGTAATSASASVAATTPSGMATSVTASGSAAAGAAKTSAAAGAATTNGANKLAGAGLAAFAGITVAVLSGVFC